MSNCILLFGRDKVLLSTRQMVLARIGMPVLSTTDLNDLEAFAAIYLVAGLLLCHTIYSMERQDAVRRVRIHHPNILCLSVLPLDFISEQAVSADVIFAASGPESLLETVRSRLGMSADT